MDKKQKEVGKAFADGYQNLMANIGMNANNMLGASKYESSIGISLDRQQLDNMFTSSWIVGKAIDIRADDMTADGIEIKSHLDPEQLTKIYETLQNLGIANRLGDAIKWSTLYGGAIAVLLIDGQDMAQPLDFNAIGQHDFKGLRIYSMWECEPSQELIDDLGPMEGLPKYYTINTADRQNGLKIHYSRAIRFVGIEVPYYERMRRRYWGASLVERWFDRLCAYDSATFGAANLLFKSFLRVFKIEDLREILATGGAEEMALAKSIKYMRMFESNEGITITDKRDDFQVFNNSFSGMPETIHNIAEQISGATEIPLVKLLGQSPSGFSTGDSDLENYYRGIQTKQNSMLRPAYNLILPVLEASLFGNNTIKSWEFDFKPLWTLSEKEKAEIAINDVNAIKALFDSGIISRACALKELKDRSRLTGRFTNITPDEIDAAEKEETVPEYPVEKLNEVEESLIQEHNNGQNLL